MSNFDANMITAAILLASGKANGIKEAVHMASQIEESIEARLIRASPNWAKSATANLKESNERAARVAASLDGNEEEE